jgi:hypothetical protein
MRRSPLCRVILDDVTENQHLVERAEECCDERTHH